MSERAENYDTEKHQRGQSSGLEDLVADQGPSRPIQILHRDLDAFKCEPWGLCGPDASIPL